MRTGDIAATIGKGLIAGVVGTAAMTVSSTIEARLRHRAASTAPADAAGIVLGVQPRDEAGAARFSNAVHWGYGTTWGAIRGLLAALGLRVPTATAAHLAAVWGSELVMLPALGVAPPVKTWTRTDIAIDAWHHLVYVTATSITYVALERHTSAI